MDVVIFGASGMVGRGVLRECLLDSGVDRVTAIGRSASGASHAKLRDMVHRDLGNYADIEKELTGLDACFFCLGVTSAGMKEADYERVTYGVAAAAAETLARRNPRMTFVFVSGAGADSSEKGARHVGADQGQGRKCHPAPAVSRVRLPARRDPAAPRDSLANQGL
jgi:uncharacterized protein YbjT (DUF2867 family)